MSRMCVRCRVKVCNRPRGLCWTCYYTDHVREQTPSTSRYAARGARGEPDALPERTADMPLPEPTDTYPGTPERQAVIEERVRRGQQLWHPDDRSDCEGLVGHPAGSTGLHARRSPARRTPTPTPPPSPQETIRMSESNGTHTAPPVSAGEIPRPANRLHATQVLRGLLRDGGTTITYDQVAARAPWVTPQMYHRQWRDVHPDHPMPRRKSGPRAGGEAPAAKPRPKVQAPAPSRIPTPAPVARPLEYTAPPAGDDDLVALVDDVIRLVDRLGAERLTRLVGAIGRRGGAR